MHLRLSSSQPRHPPRCADFFIAAIPFKHDQARLVSMLSGVLAPILALERAVFHCRSSL